MGFDRPQGNVIINTKRGEYSKVREKDRRAYILPDAEAFPANEPRTYYGNGNGQSVKFVVSEYANDIRELSAMKFL